MKERLRRLVGPLLTLLAVAFSAWGLGLMLVAPKTVAPALIVGLAVGHLVCGAVASAAQWRPNDWQAALGGAVLAAGAATDLVSLGLAVAAERQNYWDALHFASIYWCATLAVIGSLAPLIRRARTGSLIGEVLTAIAGVVAFVCAFLLLYMSVPAVQELEGAITRWLFLLTHG